MKATIEFSLPDESLEYCHAVNADHMATLIWNLDTELRTFLKHGNKDKKAEELAIELRQMISTVLERIAE